jgi:pescadillo
LNKSTFLNVSDYAPGETLPPHLSPWGDAGTYDPEAPLEEGEGDEDEEEEEEEDAEAEKAEEEEEEEEVDEELKKQKELEMEAAGVKYSAVQGKDSKKRKHDDIKDGEKDEKDLKLIMMSNKQRKLYKKMQYGLNKQDNRKAALEKKRKQLAKKKAQIASV